MEPLLRVTKSQVPSPSRKPLAQVSAFDHRDVMGLVAMGLGSGCTHGAHLQKGTGDEDQYRRFHRVADHK